MNIFNNKMIFAKFLSPILFFLSCFLSWLIGNVSKTSLIYKILEKLDKTFSYRLSLASRCFNDFSISIFGGNLDLSFLAYKYAYPIIDNGYVYVLYNFGLFACGYIIFIYYFTIKKLYKLSQYKYILMIIVILLLAFTENILISFTFNFTYLLCTTIFDDEITVLKVNKNFLK